MRVPSGNITNLKMCLLQQTRPDRTMPDEVGKHQKKEGASCKTPSPLSGKRGSNPRPSAWEDYFRYLIPIHYFSLYLINILSISDLYLITFHFSFVHFIIFHIFILQILLQIILTHVQNGYFKTNGKHLPRYP